MTNLLAENNQDLELINKEILNEFSETQIGEIQIEESHSPHIPRLQGDLVYGPISNTTISLFIFLILISIFSIFTRFSLKKDESRLKTACISFVSLIDGLLQKTFGEKKFARSYFPLVGGFLIIILFGNIFGLIIDWAGESISPDLLTYLRPINSDLNTTRALGLITLFTMIYISFKYTGGSKTFRKYLFNFEGEGFFVKVINVFVGWIELIGLPSSALSLSLRLFGNIFAGIIVISIISYLGVMVSGPLFEIGRLLTIPLWFFELFVAFIQALVFVLLMMSYFNNSKGH